MPGIKNFTLPELTWWLKNSRVKLLKNILPQTGFKKLHIHCTNIHHQICVHLSYRWRTKLSYKKKAFFDFQSACVLTGNYFAFSQCFDLNLLATFIIPVMYSFLKKFTLQVLLGFFEFFLFDWSCKWINICKSIIS